MNDVGLVLVDDGPQPAYSRGVAALVHGLEERLLGEQVRLVTRIVPDRRGERAVYRTWRREQAVDAVVLMDVRAGDRRIAVLRELELPFVAVADRSRLGDFSAVTVDTQAMVGAVLRFLAERGWARVVHVRSAGPALGEVRSEAFAAGAAAAGVEVDAVPGGPSDVDAAELALAATGATGCAVVFDDDTSAVAAMERFARTGRRVPEDVGIFAWSDSPLCQTADPAVSALNGRADAVGDLVGVCLLRSEGAAEPVHLAAPAPFVVARRSA